MVHVYENVIMKEIILYSEYMLIRSFTFMGY